MDTSKEILLNLAQALPVMLVALAGIIISLLRWQRHPKSSLLVLLSSILYLGLSIFTPVIYQVLSQLSVRREVNFNTLGYIYRAVTTLLYIVEAVALALLISAAFTGRGTAHQAAQKGE